MTDDRRYAFESDVRFKGIMDFINEAAKRMKKQHTGKLSKEDEKLIEETRQKVISIGMQMEGVYVDQPGLLPDIPTRKAVQETWNRHKKGSSGGRSKSGAQPMNPLRS